MAAARAKYTQQVVSGELEKEAEDDRKAEAAKAAQEVHKTADHAPTFDQDMWARDHGTHHDTGACQFGENLLAIVDAIILASQQGTNS
jgi:hypothetical protein